MLNIIARTETGIIESLSNFSIERVSYEARINKIRALIEKSPVDVKNVCKRLNAYKYTTERFKPYLPTDDGFIIQAVDPFGNYHYITIEQQ